MALVLADCRKFKALGEESLQGFRKVAGLGFEPRTSRL